MFTHIILWNIYSSSSFFIRAYHFSWDEDFLLNPTFRAYHLDFLLICNVFKTISEGGRAGKGMVAWKTNLKPSEIAQVASYVLGMHGTTPANPKDPEGEIWIDPNAPVDEVEVEVDSTGVEVLMENETSNPLEGE